MRITAPKLLEILQSDNKLQGKVKISKNRVSHAGDSVFHVFKKGAAVLSLLLVISGGFDFGSTNVSLHIPYRKA